MFLQEDQNRGKPNWEHLNDELHVLITVEDSDNRAKMKLQRAVEEVKKLLVVVSFRAEHSGVDSLPKYMKLCPSDIAKLLFKKTISESKARKGRALFTQ